MKSVGHLVRQADSLMAQEKYDEAEPLLLVAIKHNPTEPEAHYLLGEVYCKQQRFGESVAVLKKANMLLPNNGRIVHLLGWATFMNGDVGGGRGYMTRALAQLPIDIQLLCDLAVLEMNDRDFLKAKEYARTAANLAPEDGMVQEVNAVVDAMSAAYSEIKKKN